MSCYVRFLHHICIDVNEPKSSRNYDPLIIYITDA